MDEESIKQRLLADEYEIQHYEFSSSALISDFKKYINNTIKSIHVDLEKCIETKLELSDENKENLHKEMEIITESYLKHAEKCIKKKEPSIHKFFEIPQNIILEEDKIHQNSSNESVDNLLNEIKKLEQEYIKERSLCTLYEKELKDIEKTSALQNQMSIALKQFNKYPDFTEEEKTLNKLHNAMDDITKKIEKENKIKLVLKQHNNEFKGSVTKTPME